MTKKVSRFWISLVIAGLVLVVGALIGSYLRSGDVACMRRFVQRICRADRVVVQGRMHNLDTDKVEDVCFTLETSAHKKVLHDFMSNLDFRLDRRATRWRRNGTFCACLIRGVITSHFDDKTETFGFVCQGLISSTEAVFAVCNKDFDHNEYFMTLKNAGIPYEKI